MSYQVLICDTEQIAQDISFTVGRMALSLEDRPQHAMQDSAFAILKKSGTAQAALLVPTDWIFFVTKKLRGQMEDIADSSGIKMAMLNSLPHVLVGGALTLAALQEAFRGTETISIASLLPYLQPAKLFSLEQALTDGWFPAPTMA